MITIYGKSGCGFCAKATSFAKSRNFAYEYKSVETSKHMEELKEAIPDVRSVPQIFIYGKHVGGYQDLISYVENTGYTGTGHSL